MQVVERGLLKRCVKSLKRVSATLKNERLGTLIDPVQSGKSDSLFLDVLPENALQLSLIKEYDDHIVLITEEKGQFNFEEISNAEVVVFADPTDRSKHLKLYIEAAISKGLVTSDSVLKELLRADRNFELWREIDHEGAGDPFSPSITGPCCALTVIKRGEVLFAVALNYVTEDIFVACSDFIGFCHIDSIKGSSVGKDFAGWTPVEFSANPNPSSKDFVTYLGKQYEENLQKTSLIDATFTPLIREPGGPLRILFLSNLCNSLPGFILANGEKIGEWIHWLAFCRYSPELSAYSVFPETFFAKEDGILMTPSPPYSILETNGSVLQINFEKLRYLGNPSRYREMIWVAHRKSVVMRARIESNTSRGLFT